MKKQFFTGFIIAIGMAFAIFVPAKIVPGFTGAVAPEIAFAQQIQTQSANSDLTIPTQQTQNLSLSPTGNSGAAANGTQSGGPATVGGGAGSAPVQSPSFFSCALSGGNIATCGVYYVTYQANAFMGLLISVGAFLVRLGLQFNDNVYNSPAVQTGFSVALAIANLGFVLGIIIIAIATILRNQTYGIKQLLWKLVFMAILVNFGLVITAPVVGFAGSMSNYFITAISNGQSQQGTGYEGFAQTMTKAFAPQDLQIASTQTSAANTAATSVSNSNAGGNTGCTAGIAPGLDVLCSLTAKFLNGGTGSDQFVQMTMAMMFDVVFSALIAFTFLCLAILLIVRYLMLAGLLIILPFAWLAFIFPKFDNSFSKWWNNFIKWSLFPPLALFFIYLAFITATNTSTASAGASGMGNTYMLTAAGLPASDGTGPEAALVYQTGLAGPIQQAADEILLVGLTIMGLMFAQSLSGKAGSTVVGGVANASRATVGYIGKKSKHAAGRLVGDRVRNMGRQYNPETKETTTALQRFGARLQGIPIVGKKAGSALANYTAPKAIHADRKEEIEKYIKGNLENLPADGLLTRAKSATGRLNPTVAAAMAQELAKRNLLNEKDLGSSKLLESYVEYAEKMGTAEEVFNNRPDLVKPRKVKDSAAPGGFRDETREETMGRAVGNTRGEIINVNAQVLNYAKTTEAMEKLGLTDAIGKKLDPTNPTDVATAETILKAAALKINSAQLGTLGSDQSKGSEERKENLTASIKKIIASIPASYNIKKEIYSGGRPTGNYQLDNTAFKKYRDDREVAGASKTELAGIENLANIIKHMQSSSNWANVLV